MAFSRNPRRFYLPALFLAFFACAQTTRTQTDIAGGRASAKWPVLPAADGVEWPGGDNECAGGRLPRASDRGSQIELRLPQGFLRLRFRDDGAVEGVYEAIPSMDEGSFYRQTWCQNPATGRRAMRRRWPARPFDQSRAHDPYYLDQFGEQEAVFVEEELSGDGRWMETRRWQRPLAEF